MVVLLVNPRWLAEFIADLPHVNHHRRRRAIVRRRHRH
jgi:hypothetical protein